MKVLIIDDSMFMRTLIKQTVNTSGQDPLEIKEAMDAEEALMICTQFKPDLFIVDLNLPGMSGLDLIETIKRESPRSKFGIITSSKNPEVNLQARAAGASFFISKPFTKSGVQEALKHILS
jgi:YesN/AraC family two-component response regulator